MKYVFKLFQSLGLRLLKLLHGDVCSPGDNLCYLLCSDNTLCFFCFFGKPSSLAAELLIVCSLKLRDLGGRLYIAVDESLLSLCVQSSLTLLKYF